MKSNEIHIYPQTEGRIFSPPIKAIEERKSQQNIFDFGYLCFGVCIDFSNMRNMQRQAKQYRPTNISN